MNCQLGPKVAVTIVLVALLVMVGVLKNPSAMILNLIAELAGVALGAWLTVTLVEEMLERRHRKQWEGVRHQVVSAILSDVMDIAWWYLRWWDQAILRSALYKGSKPTQEALDDMKAMLKDMRQKTAGWWVQELFRSTEWRFDHLRDVLTPRIIDVGEEQKLIERLTGVDGLHTDWKDSLRMLEGDLRQLGLPFDKSSVESLSTLGEVEYEALMSLNESFEAAMKTLEALSELYACLIRG